MVKIKEGTMPFGGSQTYFRIAGEKTDKLPLLALHGGPGASHSYLTSLDDLAEGGRQVIYYDQIGGGKSTAPSDPSRWVPSLFLEELQALVKYLSLGKHHIFGNSWGGMLAIEYAATQPEKLVSAVLSSTPISTPQWNMECARLLSEMPDDIRIPLENGEASGNRDTREYQEALGKFYQTHLCTVEMPDFVAESFSSMGEVYHTMQGESELKLTGSLRDYDLTGKLPFIEVPTLVTSGKHDQCTALVVKTTLDGIKNSRAILYENSAHIAFVEERALFMKNIEEFLINSEK